MRKYFLVPLLMMVAIGFVKCKSGLPPGDPGNGGLMLPGGFEAVVVVDSIGGARHIAVNENGDIYVKLRNSYPNGSNIAMRDENNDGKADIIKRFGVYSDPSNYGTAMRINNGYIYYSSTESVYRSKLVPGQLLPDTAVETILTDDFYHDPHGYNHTAKAVAFDDKGMMYVGFGSPSDACQVLDRIPESPGQNPCPQLEEHAGLWKFDPNKQNQTIKDGKRFATGIRSIVAMDWNTQDNHMYVVQHGRDEMHRTWPAKYTRWESVLLPAEEFLKLEEGSDAGWPYYYYDQVQGKKLLNPEYGADGKKEGNGAKYLQPLIGFPGHFGPNDLLFYTGDQFPERYKNGAFVAFHGSTIRSPYSQAGYFIAFVPFKNGAPSGPGEVFADGFSGKDTIPNTSDANGRPMGLAQGSDGSLYMTESVKGKVWRVMYKGDKEKFSDDDLAIMAKRKTASAHIKDPDEFADNLEKGKAVGGEQVYNIYCIACHQGNGKGDGSRFPPLENSEWVTGDKKRLIGVLLNGLEKPITVNGKVFNNLMPQHSFLTDEQLATVLTYIRQNFNNSAAEITPGEVATERKNNKPK